MPWPWVLLGVLIGAVLLLAFWLLGRRSLSVARARALFQAQRGPLEEQFFRAAAASGKPRGLRWVGCEWGEVVEFARETATGRIVALVAVTIRFEAVAGSDMEGLPAVGNLRNASAVFTYHGGQWHATGRAVFNLNPDEAIAHFGTQYERLTPEPFRPGS